LREPFGIVFIEAMKYRLPIVANNVGCLPDLVKNDYNGYLINNNIDDYTNAISMLFEDPAKCRQLGENGFNLAQTKFSWQLVGEKIKKHIEPYIDEWQKEKVKDI
jgi:glycosyltransferase involved in cell wall biosynthesis